MSIHSQHDTALSFLIHIFYVSPLEPKACFLVLNSQAVQAAFLLQVPWRSCKFIFDLRQKRRYAKYQECKMVSWDLLSDR